MKKYIEVFKKMQIGSLHIYTLTFKKFGALKKKKKRFIEVNPLGPVSQMGLSLSQD